MDDDDAWMCAAADAVEAAAAAAAASTVRGAVPPPEVDGRNARPADAQWRADATRPVTAATLVTLQQHALAGNDPPASSAARASAATGTASVGCSFPEGARPAHVPAVIHRAVHRLEAAAPAATACNSNQLSQGPGHVSVLALVPPGVGVGRHGSLGATGGQQGGHVATTSTALVPPRHSPPRLPPAQVNIVPLPPVSTAPQDIPSWLRPFNMNGEQLAAAVACLGTPLMIVAGAGSGKTSTIVARMVHTLRSGRCTADRILCITFTRTAAGEMRSRLARYVGEREAGKATICTFHSFARQLCRRGLDALGLAGLTRSFTLLSDAEQRDIMRAVLREDDEVKAGLPPGSTAPGAGARGRGSRGRAQAAASADAGAGGTGAAAGGRSGPAGRTAEQQRAIAAAAGQAGPGPAAAARLAAWANRTGGGGNGAAGTVSPTRMLTKEYQQKLSKRAGYLLRDWTATRLDSYGAGCGDALADVTFAADRTLLSEYQRRCQAANALDFVDLIR
jgi:hypothetical protein